MHTINPNFGETERKNRVLGLLVTTPLRNTMKDTKDKRATLK